MAKARFLQKILALLRRLFGASKTQPKAVFDQGAHLEQVDLPTLFRYFDDPAVQSFDHNGVHYEKSAFSSPNTRIYTATQWGATPRLIKIMDGNPLEFYQRLGAVYKQLGDFAPKLYAHCVHGDAYISEVNYETVLTLDDYVDSLTGSLEDGIAAMREIAKSLAITLHQYHKRKVYFTDLKPANLAVKPDGHLMMIDPKYAYNKTDTFLHCGFTKDYEAPVVKQYGRRVPVETYSEQLKTSFAQIFTKMLSRFMKRFDSSAQAHPVVSGFRAFIEDVRAYGLFKAAKRYFSQGSPNFMRKVKNKIQPGSIHSSPYKTARVRTPSPTLTRSLTPIPEESSDSMPPPPFRMRQS